MKKIVFITPREARYGFSLCGVTQDVVAPEEAEAAILRAMGDPDIGVVIIDERLIEAVGDERFREMEKRWFGILLVLPSPEWGGEPEEDYAQRMIRRAIGYHVRLNV
jgi:vacuolar-type H+-ATPase subunit F/Vma7